MGTKVPNRPLSKQVPVESGSAESYLLHQLQTKYSWLQKSVVEVESPSKNNHLYKTKGSLYIIFYVVSKEEYFLPWECVLARITKTGRLPKGLFHVTAPSPWHLQHLMAAINIHCCRWVFISINSLINECKLRTSQPRTTHSDGSGWLFRQEKRHFCQEMPCPSPASQNSARRVYGCAIVPPKKFRTCHPAPSQGEMHRDF